MRSVARCGHNVLYVRFLRAVDGVYALRRSLSLRRLVKQVSLAAANEVVVEWRKSSGTDP